MSSIFLPGGAGDASLLEDAAPAAATAANASRANRQLLLAMVLCFVFMIGEVIGGYLAGSLAIMTECVCGRALGRGRSKRHALECTFS